MTNLMRSKIFPMMSNASVFNEFIDEFFNKPTSLIGKERISYPMNIIKVVENGVVSAYRLEYALAGFKKDEIKVTINKDILKVEANHSTDTVETTENTEETDESKDNYNETIYNGISYRNLSMSYKLMNNVDKENISIMKNKLKETLNQIKEMKFAASQNNQTNETVIDGEFREAPIDDGPRMGM